MTVEELATELGIDIATAKPEGLTKVRGFLGDVDRKYSEAQTLAETAQANLRKVQEEQDEINRYIAQYGESETTNAALRANYAAMEAQLKTLREQGIDVKLPDALPANRPAANGNPPANNGFDAGKFASNMGSLVNQGFKVANKYLALTGNPMPDDIEDLMGKASAAGKSLYDYAAEKYDFAGIERRKAEDAQKKHDDEVAAKAVREYQEKHPNAGANPLVNGGVESQFPQILKPRETKDFSEFARMSPRQKVAASVARTREQLVAANQ